MIMENQMNNNILNLGRLSFSVKPQNGTDFLSDLI
jgi:hypothetical protein